jgi:ATP-dependent exoDNAse (exonuclease V) alpha subunit
MFLRNERSLGVKNGTLGTIERVNPEGMAVRLDGGREVRSTSRIMPPSITAMPRPSTNRRA